MLSAELQQGTANQATRRILRGCNFHLLPSFPSFPSFFLLFLLTFFFPSEYELAWVDPLAASFLSSSLRLFGSRWQGCWQNQI
jgi:hypothetical protein